LRNFDASLIDEIEKEVTSTFFLLELNLASTYYYTDSDYDIYYNGHNYLSMGFKFSDIAYAANMSVDKVSIDFDNVGLTMSAILLGEDVRNKTAKLSFGCYGTMGMVWDSGIEWDAGIQWLEGTTIIGVVDLFQGIISDWNLSETMAQMTIVNEFILWKKKTLRIAQATCPWGFKEAGGECRYTGGETWCDQSYERCKALGNTDNFGGFRFLPSIAEKSIWWGRVQG